MRLRATKTLNGVGLFYSTYVKDYLDRVTAADVTAGNTLGLERGATQAINTAIESLVAVGFLGVSGGVINQAASNIKQMIFIRGARTLAGSLVPVVGPTPTNFNFVAADYNRKTGLGDPANATKYILLNYAQNADPQDDAHLAVRLTTASNLGPGIIGVGSGSVNSTHIAASGTNELVFRSRSITAIRLAGQGGATGFIGHTRSVSGSIDYRLNGTTTTVALTSAGTSADSYRLLGQATFPNNNFSTARADFCSAGRNINLATLQTIIDTLAASIAAAIP